MPRTIFFFTSGSAQQIAHAVRDLIRQTPDLFLFAAFDHHPDQGLGARRAQQNSALARQFRLGRGDRSPHGLRTTRMLRHGAAYLEFDGLPGDDASMEAVTQALADLPDVKAVILDLRDNIGGSADMVVLLCSHVLEVIGATLGLEIEATQDGFELKGDGC